MLAPQGECTKKSCSAVLTASVTGPPIGSSSTALSLNLVLDPRQADEITSCYAVTGSGALGTVYTANFVGQICPSMEQFNLSGNLAISTTDLCASPWQAMSGELNAFGRNHTAGPTPMPTSKPRGHPPNPIWAVGESAVGIVGTATQRPAPCPSP